MARLTIVLGFAVLVPGLSDAATGPAVPEMVGCDALVTDFIERWNLPGLSMALAKDGRLVYMRGFGTVDLDGTEATQPYHMYRLASVSKPITAIAVMKMIEEGRLSLDDRVFGPGGLLEGHPDEQLRSAPIVDGRLEDATVRDLLEHAVGWDRSIDCFPIPTIPYGGWVRGCDPISAPLHVAWATDRPNPAPEEAMIEFLMSKPSAFAPGTDYAYSNIGYTVLGEILEIVSGQEYESHLKSEILSPLGICDMHVGRNLLEDKFEREAEYVTTGTSLSCYGTGDEVPVQYGGFNLEAMGAHGGWIASARELTRLLVAVDGFDTKPDILAPATIATMTEPSASAEFYAKGWAVNAADNWWHTGGLPGTATCWARTSGGYTWAVLINRRQGGDFYRELDALPWECIAATVEWPEHDLMAMPSLSASELRFSDPAGDSVQVSWTPGDGDARLLVVSEGAPLSEWPLDGVSYSANARHGAGDPLGNGHVVHAGVGDTIEVTGLTPGVDYHFRLFEFTQGEVTGGHALYRLCGSPEASMDPGCRPAGVVRRLELGRPSVDEVRLTWQEPSDPGSGEPLYDTLRSMSPDFADATCIELDGADLTTSDTVEEGATVYYLVRATGSCGDGPLGQGHDGRSPVERLAPACF
jgi:CubicO group peptidase (beta-lactamase class C family)